MGNKNKVKYYVIQFKYIKGRNLHVNRSYDIYIYIKYQLKYYYITILIVRGSCSCLNCNLSSHFHNKFLQLLFLIIFTLNSVQLGGKILVNYETIKMMIFLFPVCVCRSNYNHSSTIRIHYTDLTIIFLSIQDLIIDPTVNFSMFPRVLGINLCF